MTRYFAPFHAGYHPSDKLVPWLKRSRMQQSVHPQSSEVPQHRLQGRESFPKVTAKALLSSSQILGEPLVHRCQLAESNPQLSIWGPDCGQKA